MVKKATTEVIEIRPIQMNLALSELLAFKKKYAQLEELAAVFTAIDEVA